MGHVFDEISPEIAEWIEAQPMFFVATAPLAGDGRVNVSPKGHDTLRVLGPHELAWLDLTGSGAETIAHLREPGNGRITLMWNAFDGPPRILRAQGTGTVHLPGSGRFDELVARFPADPGTRSVITVAAERLSSSCGFGVPLMSVVGERDGLRRFAERKGPDGMTAYRATHNARSIDGLPALDG